MKKDKTALRLEKECMLKEAQNDFLKTIENLPELVGSEKQIKWADDIRRNFIEKVKENINTHSYHHARMKYNTFEFYVLSNIISKKIDSKYYIDNRDNLQRPIIGTDFADEYILMHLKKYDPDNFRNTILDLIKNGMSYSEIINKLENKEI